MTDGATPTGPATTTTAPRPFQVMGRGKPVMRDEWMIQGFQFLGVAVVVLADVARCQPQQLEFVQAIYTGGHPGALRCLYQTEKAITYEVCPQGLRSTQLVDVFDNLVRSTRSTKY